MTYGPEVFYTGGRKIGEIETILGMPVVWIGKGIETGPDWYIRVGCFCDYEHQMTKIEIGSPKVVKPDPLDEFNAEFAQALAIEEDEVIMKDCSPVEFVQEFVKALNVMGTMLEVLAQEWEVAVKDDALLEV